MTQEETNQTNLASRVWRWLNSVPFGIWLLVFSVCLVLIIFGANVYSEKVKSESREFLTVTITGHQIDDSQAHKINGTYHYYVFTPEEKLRVNEVQYHELEKDKQYAIIVTKDGLSNTRILVEILREQ